MHQTTTSTAEYNCYGQDFIVKMKNKYQNEKPSTCLSDDWIWAFNKTTENNSCGDENVGKWMIFRDRDSIDATWAAVRTEIINGKLGASAKVSTGLGQLRHVICIYTYNHEDEVDVMRAREYLRTMGFTEKLGYKTDAATNAGVYRATGHKKVCKYRC